MKCLESLGEDRICRLEAVLGNEIEIKWLCKMSEMFNCGSRTSTQFPSPVWKIWNIISKRQHNFKLRFDMVFSRKYVTKNYTYPPKSD